MVLGMRITCRWVHGTKLKEHLPFQHPYIVSCSVSMFPEKKVRFEKKKLPLDLPLPHPKAICGTILKLCLSHCQTAAYLCNRGCLGKDLCPCSDQAGLWLATETPIKQCLYQRTSPDLRAKHFFLIFESRNCSYSFPSACNCTNMLTLSNVELLLFIRYVPYSVIRRNVFFQWVPLETLMAEKFFCFFLSGITLTGKKSGCGREHLSCLTTHGFLPLVETLHASLLSTLASKTQPKSWKESCLVS